MTKVEFASLFLIGLGCSGILFLVIYNLSYLIPVLIEQHGRLSCIGFVSIIMIAIGAVMLKWSIDQR